MAINPVSLTLVQPEAAAGSQSKPAAGFGDILKRSVNAVNDLQQEAGALQQGLLAGEHSNIHETMIAMEKASLSFRMLAKAQTKVIDAYKEVMRMQL